MLMRSHHDLKINRKTSKPVHAGARDCRAGRTWQPTTVSISYTLLDLDADLTK